MIEPVAAVIHDPALREAAIRAAVRALEWRKGLKARKTPENAAGGPQRPDSEVEH